jgi:hypothetical protein
MEVEMIAVKKDMKREKMMTVVPKQGQVMAYSADELKKALQALRDFVAFDLAAELGENSSISAWRLSSELMPLDYLIREVEFKEVEVLV